MAGISKEKKGYIATTGIDFEGLKGKPHCEPGDALPDGVTEATIKDLLANGDIQEAK